MKSFRKFFSTKVPTSLGLGIIVLFSLTWGYFLVRQAPKAMRYENFVLPQASLRREQ